MDQAVDTAPERPCIDWTRWLPAIAPEDYYRWRLIRFERVDDAGQPVGQPLVSMTPQGTERRFPNVMQAEWAAAELNRLEGL